MPRHLVLFGIGPAEIDTGLELSDPVAAGLPKLLAGVIEDLEKIGSGVFAREMLYNESHA